jgi:hypothetical protein
LLTAPGTQEGAGDASDDEQVIRLIKAVLVDCIH